MISRLFFLVQGEIDTCIPFINDEFVLIAAVLKRQFIAAVRVIASQVITAPVCAVITCMTRFGEVIALLTGVSNYDKMLTACVVSISDEAAKIESAFQLEILKEKQ